MLHLTMGDVELLEGYLKYLPGGLKMFGGYVLAHKAYLKKIMKERWLLRI